MTTRGPEKSGIGRDSQAAKPRRQKAHARRGIPSRPPPTPPGSNNGGGRKAGWAYFTNRAQLQLYLREVINEVRVGRWDERTQSYVKMQPHEANALCGLARTILDSMKFTEETSLKVSDRSTQERMQQLEHQLAELEECFVNQHELRQRGIGKGQPQ